MRRSSSMRTLQVMTEEHSVSCFVIMMAACEPDRAILIGTCASIMLR